jgi:heme-degrading monooxygenase HmoA
MAGADGFRSLRLARCRERPNRYLLLVEWDSLADHVEGLGRSEPFARWRQLLHHVYDPFPTVEHFTVDRQPERRLSNGRPAISRAWVTWGPLVSS